MNCNSESSCDLRDLNTRSSLLEPGRERDLCERYRRAIRCYVGVLLNDEEAADDVAHNFYVKMLTPRIPEKNPFRNYDSKKGRFRDYLRQAIRNAVKDHWKATEKRPRPLEGVDDRGEPGGEKAWISLWRRELIGQALKALKAYQESHPRNEFYLIVCLLGDSWMEGGDPAADQGKSVDGDEQLAAELTRRTGREYQVRNVRQQKSRARKKLAELLVEEIQSTLGDSSPERIVEELHELRLIDVVQQWLPADLTADGQEQASHFSPVRTAADER